MIPVSMVVYWMMILRLKEGDTCVNGGLLNDDTLIKTLKVIPVSMVVYWMMILWLKKVIPVSMVVYWMIILWLKEGDTCVNGGLLIDDTLINTKWYLCQLWFIEWWYFD